MNINLLKLKLKEVKKIEINDVINIDKKYYENTDIKDISDVRVNGKILYHGEDVFELILNIKCSVKVPCSISLELINLDLNINVNENLSSDSDEENNKIINNCIDLIPIIWQNIILEVPLKVVSPNVDRSKMHGDGWRLITDEDEIKQEDPRLEKLKEFLDE